MSSSELLLPFALVAATRPSPSRRRRHRRAYQSPCPRTRASSIPGSSMRRASTSEPRGMVSFAQPAVMSPSRRTAGSRAVARPTSACSSRVAAIRRARRLAPPLRLPLERPPLLRAGAVRLPRSARSAAPSPHARRAPSRARRVLHLHLAVLLSRLLAHPHAARLALGAGMPPYLSMSRQLSHRPQSVAAQPPHSPQALARPKLRPAVGTSP